MPISLFLYLLAIWAPGPLQQTLKIIRQVYSIIMLLIQCVKRAFEIFIQILGTEMLAARSGEQGELTCALLCYRLTLACSDAHFFSMYEFQ